MAGKRAAMETQFWSTQRALSSHLSAGEPADVVLPRVLEIVCADLACSAAVLWSADSSGAPFVAMASWPGGRDPTPPAELSEAFEGRAPVWRSNLLAVPVTAGEHVAGALELRFADAVEPDPDLLRPLELTAGRLALYLDDASRRDQIRLVLEALGEGVVVLDRHGRITTFNRAA